MLDENLQFSEIEVITKMIYIKEILPFDLPIQHIKKFD